MAKMSASGLSLCVYLAAQLLGCFDASAQGPGPGPGPQPTPDPWIVNGSTINPNGLKVITAASTTSQAGFNLPHGAAPSAPVNGDLWTTTGGMFTRVNGVTVQWGGLNVANTWTQTQTFSAIAMSGASSIFMNAGPASPVTGVSQSVDWNWGTTAAQAELVAAGSIYAPPLVERSGVGFSKICNNADSPGSNCNTSYFYAQADNANQNVVPVIMQCLVNVANGACWGFNSIVSDSGVDGAKLTGEIDCAPTPGHLPSTDSTCLAINILNRNLRGPAVFINTPNGGGVTNGIAMGGTYNSSLIAVLGGSSITNYILDASQVTPGLGAIIVHNASGVFFANASGAGTPAEVVNDSSNNFGMSAGSGGLVKVWTNGFGTCQAVADTVNVAFGFGTCTPFSDTGLAGGVFRNDSTTSTRLTVANAGTGLNSASQFALEVGSNFGTGIVVGALINNSGSPYYQLSGGSAVTNWQMNFPSYNWQDNAGTPHLLMNLALATTANLQIGNPGTTGGSVKLSTAANSNTLSLITATIATASRTVTFPDPGGADTVVYNALAATLTNKTISGASNTLSNIGNASLTNSATTVNGQTCTLGSTCTVTAVASSLVMPVTVSGTVTSGGIPYFSSTTNMATSALLAANALMIGGGAGVAPSTTTTGTGVITALGINVGSAGAFVTFNGAGGTPSSMTATNLTGTASGLTAGNVTTNANLTGVITSSGNATSIASQTGTGTKFVVDTSPTIVTPTIVTATITNINAPSGQNVNITGSAGNGVVFNGGSANEIPAQIVGNHSDKFAFFRIYNANQGSNVVDFGVDSNGAGRISLPTAVAAGSYSWALIYQGTQQLGVSTSGVLTVNSATMLATNTSFTNGAAASSGTLTNAPAAGNPTKWVPINDNGTTRYVPTW